jgi:hypothetical protein
MQIDLLPESKHTCAFNFDESTFAPGIDPRTGCKSKNIGEFFSTSELERLQSGAAEPRR